MHSAEEYSTNHINSDIAIYRHVRRYWEYVYFIATSLTGCGYGDIVMVTFIGRCVLVFFIIISFGYFLLEFYYMIDVIKEHYHNIVYDRVAFVNMPKVIVSGQFNHKSLQDFLQIFNHPTKYRDHTDIIIVVEKEPDEELNEVVYKYKNTRIAIGNLLVDDNIRDVVGNRSIEESCLIVLVNNENQNR